MSSIYAWPDATATPSRVVTRHFRKVTSADRKRGLYGNWNGETFEAEVTNIVGCIDSDHVIYSDGHYYRYSPARDSSVTRESAQKADGVAVYVPESPYRNVAPTKVAFLCTKHLGVQKRLITQGKNPGVTILREKDTFTLDAIDVPALAAEAEKLVSDQRALAAKARAEYIAENRVSRILDAETSLSRAPLTERVVVETDDFGATRVHVSVGSLYGITDLSVPDARKLGAAIIEAAEKAHLANEAALS